MRKLIIACIVAIFASNSFAYYQAQQGRWMSRDPVEETGGNNLYSFIDNSPVIFIDPLGLYKVNYIEKEFDIRQLGNTGGLTASYARKTRPWAIQCPNGDNGMCHVSASAEYTQFISRVLPKVGSSRNGAWVTKSFYRQSRSHENKHVKVNKHYGKVFSQLESWQNGQKACGKQAPEQKLSACEQKAYQMYGMKELSRAGHSAEQWSIVTGWIPSTWTRREPNSRFKQEQARVFRMDGNWKVQLPKIQLDCGE